MTQRKFHITVLAFLMSAALALPTVSAAKNDAPPSQKVTVKTIGSVSCAANSVEKNEDGSLKKCVLTENKTIPVANITCQSGGPIVLDPQGIVTQCTLALDRSYPAPMSLVCAQGKTIMLHPNGTPSQCTLVAEKKAPLLGVVCAANTVAAFYADGALKQCVSTLEKKIPTAATKEVYVTEFTCEKNKPIGFYPDGNVSACTPADSIYMRGKGTAMAGEPVELYPDGKVKECSYTYPLYQNRSCKVEARASFHPNGNFDTCSLPDDKPVGKAVCKADASVSYYPDGNVASCTLAAPAEKSPGNVIPAGTVVKFDAKQAIQ